MLHTDQNRIYELHSQTIENKIQLKHPQRIVIIGPSCSGKSTLARQLSNQLNCPWIELDHLHWQPGWQTRHQDEFRKQVDKQTQQDTWICDGNYAAVRDIIWPRATTIIWLNYRFPRVFIQAIKRALTRLITQELVCGGNRETFRQTFMSKDSILLWVLTSHVATQKKCQEDLNGPLAQHAQIVSFKSPKAIHRYFKQMT